MLREHLLEGNAGIEAFDQKGQMDDTQILQIIRDFFRTEMHPESYSTQQLSIVLKKHKNQISPKAMNLSLKALNHWSVNVSIPYYSPVGEMRIRMALYQDAVVHAR